METKCINGNSSVDSDVRNKRITWPETLKKWKINEESNVENDVVNKKNSLTRNSNQKTWLREKRM